MTKDEIRDRLVELLGTYCDYAGMVAVHDDSYEVLADHLLANGVTVQECARPLEEWHEDYGDVLWWKFPIEEPPYVGSPLDEKWYGYHTHWTPIAIPEPPKEVE